MDTAPQEPPLDLSLIWALPQYRNDHLYVTTLISAGRYVQCPVCKRVVAIHPVEDEILSTGISEGTALTNSFGQVRCVADAKAI